MDPQATWNQLIEEWIEGNWLDVFELAEALIEWMNKDGFPPEIMGDHHLGTDWNRMLALAGCNYALQRVTNVLNSPQQIPNDVPFSLSCDNCSNEGPDSYFKALEKGWTEIRYYPAGLSENFLGQCSNCRQDNRNL